MGSISSCDDSNSRCSSQESLVNETRLRHVGRWEANAELFNADWRISEIECQTPRTLKAIHPGAKHFVALRQQLGRSSKRKTCHLHATVSITHQTEGRAEANLDNSPAGMPALKRVKHDCQRRQEYPTQLSRPRRSARIAAKEDRIATTPGLRRSARIAARRG